MSIRANFQKNTGVLAAPAKPRPIAKSKAATYTNKTAAQPSAGSCSARSTRPTPHPRLWQARQRPWAGVSDFLTIYGLVEHCWGRRLGRQTGRWLREKSVQQVDTTW